jgi:hypothetical protein
MRVDLDHAMVKECGEKSSQIGVIQRSATAFDWKLMKMNRAVADAKRGGVRSFLSDVESGDAALVIGLLLLQYCTIAERHPLVFNIGDVRCELRPRVCPYPMSLRCDEEEGDGVETREATATLSPWAWA